TAENKAQNEARHAFAAGTDPLSKGFARIASGSAESTIIAMTGETSRQGLVDGKWEALKYQDALEARHQTEGHPLNFGDRANKAKQFLIDDLKEAYEKSRCIDKGLPIVYGINGPPLPDIRDSAIKDKVLDELVLWVREVIRQIELVS